jgi:succinate dehydrogenase / fumarate reductase flavoprotein subunit
MMQDLVGIVRKEDELLRAASELKGLRERSNQVRVTGNREYNAGWHTALDLHHLLTVSEAITRAAIERKESRGAHFREDFPRKDDKNANFNLVISKGNGNEMQVKREALTEMRSDLRQIIEESK